MKLEYIKLENFALIEAGMKLNTLELDFRNTTNTLTLITGNNGTGKTGLLSNLHPFATLGHLEARDDMDLIIPGKNGKKTCIFRTKKHTYHIEHNYTWVSSSRSRTIKSYIQKDGVELNSAGLTGKFQEIVQREFDIDVNFLKLIRLGSNVTNFVELTASGRISFISRLLSAIEKYTKANKLVRERANELNANLKAETKKLAQLNISDISILREEIDRKKALIEHLKQERDTVLAEFYSYKGKVYQDGIEDCEDKVKAYNERIREINSSISHLEKPKQLHLKFGNEEPNRYYGRKIEENTKSHQKVTEDLSTSLAEKNKLDDERSKLQQTVDGLITEIQLKNMKENIEDLHSSIATYEEMYGRDKPSMTMEELKSDVDKINMINFHFNNIMQLDRESVRYFCEKFEEYSGDLNQIDEYARDRLLALHRKIDGLRQAESYKTIRKRNPIMFIPRECTEYRHCPYYNAYGDSDEAKEASKLGMLEAELAAIEDLGGVISSVYSIQKLLSMRPKITEYEVSMKTVMDAMVNSDIELIVDHDAVQSLRDFIGAYEDYELDKKELATREVEYKYITMAGTHNTKESVQKIIKDLTRRIDELDTKIDELYAERKRLNEDSSYWQDMIDDYLISNNYNAKRIQYDTELEKLQKDLDGLSELIDLKKAYDWTKANYDRRIKEIDDQIKSVEAEINYDRYRETTYLTIKDEIERIKERFDYVNDIKDATSQNGGIPLVHIKLYCRALCTIANNIIKDLYTGDFYLKEFDVREGVFNIPYYTKGFKVKDIRNASQAEASVAKLAISFAILSQFMTKYNIVLLDEIDGPMHRVNKERFFSALEGQLDRLKCEQAFIITQSAMFNDYPVNLIVTDPDYRSNLPNNATVIFQR